MTIFTAAFWRAAGERAVKTFAQTLAALLTASGAGILDASWQDSLSVSAMAGLISLLTSVGSDALNGGSGPSLTTAEVPAQPTPKPEVGAVSLLTACAVIVAGCALLWLLLDFLPAHTR